MKHVEKAAGFLLAAMVSASGVGAVIGVVDEVPSATLLIPYFAVDLACGPGAASTTVAVENAAGVPALVHFTLWTDLSIPSLDFDLFLPANTSDTLDLAAAFCQGVLPTRPADLTEFPGCAGTLPYSNPVLTGILLTRMRAFHTGQEFSGSCTGVDYGDQIARGSVTIDRVSTCSLLLPSDDLYYITGVIGNENQLRGSFRVIDPATQLDQTFAAVHIEADAASLGPGDPTFYERYLSPGFSDARETLPTSVTAPYSFAPFADSRFFLWREGAAFGGTFSFDCGPPPALPAPLPAGTLLVEPVDAPEETLTLVAPFEVNWFDFSSLGTVAGSDGSSSGVMTATLASQSWLASATIAAGPSAFVIPTLSLRGLLLMSVILATAAVLLLRFLR